MELKEFNELIAIDREKLAKIMTENRNFLDYDKTLDCLNYLSFPILMLLDEECLEYQKMESELNE